MTLDWSERDKAFSLFGGRMTNEQDRLAQTMAVDGTLTLQYLQRRYGLNGPNAMKLQDDLAHVAAALRAPQGETLKSLRDWAGNRADQSAGRGKPDVFEAWREVVDKIDALLPPVSPAEPTTTDDQSRSGQSGESTSDPRGQECGASWTGNFGPTLHCSRENGHEGPHADNGDTLWFSRWS